MAKLTANDGATFDVFGLSVSLDEDRALVGALGNEDNGIDSGSAYLFDLDDADSDEDGVLDSDDSCPVDFNPDQLDSDEDLLGDVCDTDDDNDTVLDDVDNCPLESNSDQADIDNDGAGDVCDPDADGDGLANEADLCPATQIPEAVPTLSLRRNRYALSEPGIDGAAPVFTSTSRRTYTTDDTAGCSCEEILAQPGFGGFNQTQYGCTSQTMNRWKRQLRYQSLFGAQ